MTRPEAMANMMQGTASVGRRLAPVVSQALPGLINRSCCSQIPRCINLGHANSDRSAETSRRIKHVIAYHGRARNTRDSQNIDRLPK
ncbi:hypothetical protein LSAT2_025778 [Lamellibrachia satsuma]|nr:hypothetical protein LSAT2_025778 [Lamellibrachia satsuma]